MEDIWSYLRWKDSKLAKFEKVWLRFKGSSCETYHTGPETEF
jgi:hypothetical protein